MSELKKILDAKKLPPVWDGAEPWEERRQAILDLLQEEEYGFLPREHVGVDFETVFEDDSFCAGKALLRKVNIKVDFGDEIFTFPVYCSLPTDGKKHPFVVHINFRSDFPDRYLPAEELCDRGFGALMFNYEDVTADDYDKEGAENRGVYPIFFKNAEIKPNSAGKIRIWAWAASRVMDYAETLQEVDINRVAVAGHSRLGKTALLAGALDQRFRFVYSNDSGCSGAAISRGKIGETVKLITRDETFRFWFCENYVKYRDNEENMPFDQHFLIAASAPRYVYVASAKLDSWADPESEFLSCLAAGEVWEKLHKDGFITPDRFPETNEDLHEGFIGYHKREGKHYFSREDWNRFIDFTEKK